MSSSSSASLDVHVRVAQQRREIVGVRPQPRILKVDDVQPAVVQHEVAAVIVAVAQDARLRGQLVRNRRPLLVEAPLRSRLAQADAPIGLEEVPDEEVELPGQLLDVEGDAIREIGVGRPAPRPAAAAAR